MLSAQLRKGGPCPRPRHCSLSPPVTQRRRRRFRLPGPEPPPDRERSPGREGFPPWLPGCACPRPPSARPPSRRPVPSRPRGGDADRTSALARLGGERPEAVEAGMWRASRSRRLGHGRGALRFASALALALRAGRLALASLGAPRLFPRARRGSGLLLPGTPDRLFAPTALPRALLGPGRVLAFPRVPSALGSAYVLSIRESRLEPLRPTTAARRALSGEGHHVVVHLPPLDVHRREPHGERLAHLHPPAARPDQRADDELVPGTEVVRTDQPLHVLGVQLDEESEVGDRRDRGRRTPRPPGPPSAGRRRARSPRARTSSPPARAPSCARPCAGARPAPAPAPARAAGAGRAPSAPGAAGAPGGPGSAGWAR